MNSDNVTWIKDGRSIEKNVFASATFVDGSFVSWRIETSPAKTSQRLAKGDLAIPHRICTANAARLERGLLKKKKKKEGKKKERQRRGNPTTGRRIFHFGYVTRAEGGRDGQKFSNGSS